MYEDGISAEQELCDRTVQILEAMESTGVSLFDNEEFLQFAATEQYPDFGFGEILEPPVKISQAVRQSFLTAEGAEPFDNL